MTTTGTTYQHSISKVTGTTDKLKRKFKLKEYAIRLFIGKKYLHISCDKCSNKQKLSWKDIEKLIK
jgi:hypothetical protein